jgi:hypothetical protein
MIALVTISPIPVSLDLPGDIRHGLKETRNKPDDRD